MSRTLTRSLRWTGAGFLVLLLLFVLLIAVLDWNWLKGPIARKVSESTGRELVIDGDLRLKLGWPPRIRAERVRFANPDWAREPQMFSVDAADASVSLWALITRRVYLPEVELTRPVIALEQSADGRKSWLLDREQSDEGKSAGVGRLFIDHGRIGYDDARQKTSVRAEVSTKQDGSGIAFSVQGTYKGNPIKAQGTGGPVLALRDDSAPYPLKVEGSTGKTWLALEGTITGLTTFSALDLKVSARGDSLDKLFPIIGIALPATHDYSSNGHLVHEGKRWRYQGFVAKVGQSDLGGDIEVDTSGKRPMLTGDLTAKLLHFDDLGPLIGTSEGGTPPRKPGDGKVLPEIPFNVDRWDTVDADVKLRARSLQKARQLPIDNFSTHLVMKDRKLTLDPLNFGVAGGEFRSKVTLDGHKKPIAAQAKIDVQKISLNRLLPTVEMNKQTSVGRIDGLVELKGNGDSVAQMLGSANGKAGLVIAGGQVSNLMMEIVGIDLWEMLKFKTQGDRPVSIRCGVYDGEVRQGVLNTNLLVLDTDDTKVVGSGNLNLAKEELDVKLEAQPKDKSLVSLRSPIHMRGSLSNPDIGPDKRKLAIRGLGALALGAVSPLLAVASLVETGPGVDSDCGKLIEETKNTQRKPVQQPAR